VDQYRRLAVKLARPVVLVDMSGVLVDWDRGFLDTWAGRSPVDRSHYEMERCVPADRYTEAKELFKSEGFYRSLPEMAGGINALQEMIRKGYEVLIVSAPLAESQYCAQEKFDWVREHLGEEWLNRVVLTMDKTSVRGDVLIDDRPIISGLQRPVWSHILFDAPYNQEVDLAGRHRLVGWNNWEAILLNELSTDPAMDAAIDAADTFPGVSGGMKRTQSVPSVPSITAEEIAELRDFSHELEGTSYLKNYRSWRQGRSRGAKGEFTQAIADIESITKEMFLDGDDWSSVHVYRSAYQNWRRGNAKGSKDSDVNDANIPIVSQPL